jgi:glycosyltransferase involved in cell wall biosynthesis
MSNNKLKPTFSIITPIYNNRIYFEECIESVLNQTFQDFEFIIIDNNNNISETEYVKATISKYKSEKIIYQKQDLKGVSNARNLGLSVAKGKYIINLDSDDHYFNLKFLDELNYELEQINDMNWVGFLDNLQKFKIVNNERVILDDTIKLGRSKNPNLIKELVHISIPEASLVLKNDLLKDARYDVNQKTGEGYSLILNLALSLDNPMNLMYKRLNTMGYAYRDSPISTTKQENWSRIELEELNKLYSEIIRNNRFSLKFRHIAFVTKLRLNSKRIIARPLMWYCKLLTNWKF